VIAFPYVGTVKVKGLTIQEVQQRVKRALSDGYMNYPVVTVALRESRSRKFFVYGEVTKPGSYTLDDSTTVLRAVSVAGGFTKFGSSSEVKVLRARNDTVGYESIKVKIEAVMNGDSTADMLLEPGDIH